LVLDIDQEPTGHCCREGRDLQLASFLYLFLRLFGHYWQQHSAQNFYLHRTLFVGITVRYRIPKLVERQYQRPPFVAVFMENGCSQQVCLLIKSKIRLFQIFRFVHQQNQNVNKLCFDKDVTL